MAGDRQRDILAELATLQEGIRLRRNLAWVESRPRWGGRDYEPTTLRRWAVLCASGNAFTTGQEIGVRDIRNFLWVHTAAFRRHPYSAWRRRRFTRYFARTYLRAPVPGRPFRRAAREQALERLVQTLGEHCQRIWADMLTGGGTGNPFTTEALCDGFICFFRRHWGWEPDRTLNTPVSQICQLHRGTVTQMSGRPEQTQEELRLQFDFQDHLKATAAEGAKMK